MGPYGLPKADDLGIAAESAHSETVGEDGSPDVSDDAVATLAEWHWRETLRVGWLITATQSRI